MHPIINIKPVSGNFDLCFQGFNLTGALLSLAAIQSGLDVVIILDQPLRWEFEPEMVTIYPIKLKQLVKSFRQIRFFEKISSLFPSKVYPQRILTVVDEKKIRSKISLFYDFILNRDREIASLPIHFSKFPSWQILANQYQNGLLVQEFRFDRNMAIIKLLLKCKQLGATIISEKSFYQQISDPLFKYACLQYQYKTSELKVENIQLGFKNNFRIVTRFFEMTSQKRDTNTIFHFQLFMKTEPEIFLKKAIKLLKSIGLESPEKYREELLSIFQKQSDQLLSIFPPENFVTDQPISTLHEYCKRTGKRISNTTGKKIHFQKWLRMLKRNLFDGYGFRQLQAECDEKFDLAKQTGIEYEKFCYYFYRYYESIDDLIELAYQQLNRNRTNPHLVWDKVGNGVKEKIEQQIFG